MYILSCESTADLTKEHFDSRNIKYVCFHYAISGKEHFDDFGASIPFEEFYKQIGKGVEVRTSQVNIDEYVAFWTPFLEQGKDIIHVSLSSGLSGGINSARNAAGILKEQFPERKIWTIDSLGASSGYGMLMDCAADRRDEGYSAEQLAEWIESNKLKIHHWFFSTDLSSYVRGGRLSKAAAVFGGALKICPLLNMNSKGQLIPKDKIRTKKRVVQEIAARMEQYADNGLDYSGKVYISHSDCYEDAKEVAELIEQRFKKMSGKVEIYWVGTTIGAHTGPGTVAMYFFGNERTE